MPGHRRQRPRRLANLYAERTDLNTSRLPEDMDGRFQTRPDAEGHHFLPITVGTLPAVPGNVEDHAIGILELALEIAVTFVAEIEEEFAAVRLDALLRLDKIVNLEAK